MNALPDIFRDGVRYRLPLSVDTLACFVAALAEDSVACRAGQLLPALVADPHFALWSVLRVAGHAEQLVRPADLAMRLAECLTHDLAAASGARSGDFPATSEPELASRHSDLLDLPIRSELIGLRACELAEQTGGDADAARLIGFVHLAVEWLVLVGYPQPDGAAALRALPPFLVRVLERIGHGDIPPLAPEFFVRQAMTEWAAGALATQLAPVQLRLVPVQQLAARLARLERLEADFRSAVEDAKLEALKEFAYGAGHEINNPLANISARAQTLLGDESDPERRQKLAAINTQAFRAHEMIADLMLFARPPELKPQRLELGPFLTELAGNWRDQAAEQQTGFELCLPAEPLAAWADKSGLAVALRALVNNALEALTHGGAIQVLVRVSGIAGAGAAARRDMPPHAERNVEILVRDNGPGIAAEIRPRIFDPYFSGREAGRGLGFGLSKCWRIVTAQGGRIEVTSDVGAGTTFTISLPAKGG
jgi:signal transduction histidine kinase